MTDADRALAPLNAAEASIEKLETYRTPQELAESLQAIGQAVERSLRQLLRAETNAPDAVRLVALSPQDLPFDALIAALRAHDLISLQLAGMLHELEQIRARAAAGDVRAADADTARMTVQHMREDLHARGDAPMREAAYNAIARHHIDEEPHTVADTRHSLKNRALLPVALLLVVLVIAAAAYALLRGDSDMKAGIAAFEREEWSLAEEKFRAVLTEDSDDVDARLYLGRVLRVQEKPADAARMLNAARKIAPGDADVMRELGHAFMDLKQPSPAIEAYRRAQELDPADAANWIGLVRALRAAGDPSAEEVLRRAPDEAQAVLRPDS